MSTHPDSSTPTQGSDWHSDWHSDMGAKLVENCEFIALSILQDEEKMLNNPNSIRDWPKFRSGLADKKSELGDLLADPSRALASTLQTGQDVECLRPDISTATIQDLAEQWTALEEQKLGHQVRVKRMWRAASKGKKSINTDARAEWPTDTVDGRIKLLEDHETLGRTVLEVEQSQDQIRRQIATLNGVSCGTEADMYCLSHARAQLADMWRQDFKTTLWDSINPLADRDAVMKSYKEQRKHHRRVIEDLARTCGVTASFATVRPARDDTQSRVSTPASSRPVTTVAPTVPETSLSASQAYSQQPQTARIPVSDVDEVFNNTSRAILKYTEMTMQEKARLIWNLSVGLNPSSQVTPVVQSCSTEARPEWPRATAANTYV